MTGILIDPFKKEVTVLEVPKWDLQAIYAAIGNDCNMIAVPIIFPHKDSLYIDDEGWFREYPEGRAGFMMDGWSYAIIGRALILGTDYEGESISPKLDDPKKWEKQIVWRNDEEMTWQGTQMGLI